MGSGASKPPPKSKSLVDLNKSSNQKEEKSGTQSQPNTARRNSSSFGSSDRPFSQSSQRLDRSSSRSSHRPASQINSSGYHSTDDIHSVGSSASGQGQNQAFLQGQSQAFIQGQGQTSVEDQGEVFVQGEGEDKFDPQPEVPSMASKPRGVIRRLSTPMSGEEAMSLKAKHKELTPVLNSFGECVRILGEKDKRDEKHFDNINKMIQNNLIRKFNESNNEQRMVMANHLADIQFPKKAVDYYQYLIEEMDIEAVTNPLVDEAKADQDAGLTLIMTLREAFWNFSDSSVKFGMKIAETDLFQWLAIDLKAILEDGLEALEEDTDTFAFNSAVGIWHNCARESDIDRKYFRDTNVNAVETLLPFLKVSNDYLKMITLLALAHLLEEDQVHLMQGTKDLFSFLMNTINASTQRDDRREHGFSVSELLQGLAGVARAEGNKKMIMEQKPMDLLKKILKSQDPNEVYNAVKVIWELAFYGPNKKDFKNDKELIDHLKRLTQRDNAAEVIKAAEGASFVILGREKEVQRPSSALKKGEVPPPPPPPGKGAPPPPPGRKAEHVMISYQWADQTIILEIAKCLRQAGFTVWLDKDNMHTYMLQAMADAIEKSFVVLMCYSEKYKSSQNCRTEAEYAYQLKKKVIPLKMQRDYKPDGWLGIMVGARLFYEFSGKYKFDNKVKELLAAVQFEWDNVGKEVDDSLPPPRGDSPVKQKPEIISDPHPHAIRIEEVEKWNTNDIDQWLRSWKIDPNKLRKLKNLTGEQCEFLFKLYIRAPEFFYKCLETKFGITDFVDIMRVSNAVEDLKNRMTD